MSLTTRTRRLSFAAGTAALAAGTVLTGVGPASASPAPSHTSIAAASTTSFMLFNHGDSGLMPTWGFGGTTVCVTNFGVSTGQAKVQAVLGGAAAEYITVPAFGQQCINRWWFGNPLRITNNGYTILRATGS